MGRSLPAHRGAGRFRLTLVALDVPKTANRHGDAVALTAAIFAQYEAWIRENPEQWMWWNTRWVAADGTISASKPGALRQTRATP